MAKVTVPFYKIVLSLNQEHQSIRKQAMSIHCYALPSAQHPPPFVEEFHVVPGRATTFLHPSAPPHHSSPIQELPLDQSLVNYSLLIKQPPMFPTEARKMRQEVDSKVQGHMTDTVPATWKTTCRSRNRS